MLRNKANTYLCDNLTTFFSNTILYRITVANFVALYLIKQNKCISLANHPLPNQPTYFLMWSSSDTFNKQLPNGVLDMKTLRHSPSGNLALCRLETRPQLLWTAPEIRPSLIFSECRFYTSHSKNNHRSSVLYYGCLRRCHQANSSRSVLQVLRALLL